MTFAAVISDLDGVLVDSAAATSRAWAAWGARHGLDGAAIQARNHGRPAREALAEHVSADLLDAEAAFLLDAEVADTDGVVAFAGAAAVLALPAVAVATSCTLPLAHARLGSAGLAVPDVLVTADQVARGKPAPDAYLLAAERLAVDPHACLVVEDAPSGIAAGRAAGMTVWAVMLLSEEITPASAAGALAVLASVALIVRDRDRAAASGTRRSRSSPVAPRAPAAQSRR